MGRHRHALNVREDGLAAVLGTLVDGRRVLAAVLVDLDSGMVLDACTASSGPPSGPAPPVDLDGLGAGHAELVRVALAVSAGGAALTSALTSAPTSASDCELVLSCADGPHHLLQLIPDPHGGRVALSVVVAGSLRNLKRVRRRLRSVPRSALTAGPTTSRRPGEYGWQLGLPERGAPAPVQSWAAGIGARAPIRPGVPIGVLPHGNQAARPLPSSMRPVAEDHDRPAPPSALPPAPRRG